MVVIGNDNAQRIKGKCGSEEVGVSSRIIIISCCTSAAASSGLLGWPQVVTKSCLCISLFLSVSI